jgi:hypothetical protein
MAERHRRAKIRMAPRVIGQMTRTVAEKGCRVEGSRRRTLDPGDQTTNEVVGRLDRCGKGRHYERHEDEENPADESRGRNAGWKPSDVRNPCVLADADPGSCEW